MQVAGLKYPPPCTADTQFHLMHSEEALVDPTIVGSAHMWSSCQAVNYSTPGYAN